MGKVIAQASMSLDGFIADTNDQVGPLFDWYRYGMSRSRAAIRSSALPRPAPPTCGRHGRPSVSASSGGACST